MDNSARIGMGFEDLGYSRIHRNVVDLAKEMRKSIETVLPVIGEFCNMYGAIVTLMLHMVKLGSTNTMFTRSRNI